MKRLLGAVSLMVLVTACTVGSSTVSEAPLPSPHPSDASDQLSEAVYPYTLRWPATELETEWRYASAPWDGAARIDHGNRFTDSVATTDGALFAFGYPTGQSAPELEALIARQAVEWHACDANATDQQPLSAGGAAGILATYRCGGSLVLRWVGVHQGFGLFVGLIVDQNADPDIARTHLEDRLAELVWTR